MTSHETVTWSDKRSSSLLLGYWTYKETFPALKVEVVVLTEPVKTGKGLTVKWSFDIWVHEEVPNISISAEDHEDKWNRIYTNKFNKESLQICAKKSVERGVDPLFDRCKTDETFLMELRSNSNHEIQRLASIYDKIIQDEALPVKTDKELQGNDLSKTLRL